MPIIHEDFVGLEPTPEASAQWLKERREEFERFARIYAEELGVPESYFLDALAPSPFLSLESALEDVLKEAPRHYDPKLTRALKKAELALASRKLSKASQ